MPEANVKYQRLPGRAAGLASYRTLYLGPDHLLLVTSTGFSETYKRFYFRDIQAILVQNSRWGAWLNALGGLSLGCCLIAWFFEAFDGFQSSAAALILGAVATLLTCIPFLLHLLLGPSCVCRVQTAVQVESLPTVKRRRHAERLLQRIKPMIDTLQGSLSPQDISAAGLDVESLGLPPVVNQAARRDDDGRLHKILSWLLLADLPITLLLLLKLTWIQTPGLVLSAITCIAAVITAVKQRDTNLPPSLRLLPWVTLAFFGIYHLISILYAAYLGTRGKPGIMVALSGIEDPVLRVLVIISTTFAVAVGGFGVMQVARWRSNHPVQSPGATGPLPPPSV